MYTNSHKSIFYYVITALRKPKIREVALPQKIPIIPMEVIDLAFEKFQTNLSPELKAQMNGRLERGLEMARNGSVYFHKEPDQTDNNRMFQVKSSVAGKPPYLVDLQAKNCACPDHWSGHFCKHRIASSVIELAIQEMKRNETPTKKAQAPEPTANEPNRSNGSQLKDEPPPVIWGCIKRGKEILGVEIVSMDGELATVKALPKVVDGKKLQPQFPFEGHRNMTIVSKRELIHVKIFKHANA